MPRATVDLTVALLGVWCSKGKNNAKYKASHDEASKTHLRSNHECVSPKPAYANRLWTKEI